jgi:hypothetical protein
MSSMQEDLKKARIREFVWAVNTQIVNDPQILHHSLTDASLATEKENFENWYTIVAGKADTYGEKSPIGNLGIDEKGWYKISINSARSYGVTEPRGKVTGKLSMDKIVKAFFARLRKYIDDHSSIPDDIDRYQRQADADKEQVARMTTLIKNMDTRGWEELYPSIGAYKNYMSLRRATNKSLPNISVNDGRGYENNIEIEFRYSCKVSDVEGLNKVIDQVRSMALMGEPLIDGETNVIKLEPNYKTFKS